MFWFKHKISTAEDARLRIGPRLETGRPCRLARKTGRHSNAAQMCREPCSNERVEVMLPRSTIRMESNKKISSILAIAVLLTLAGCATNHKAGEKDWFT